jgi:general secretion pathway protein G
MGGCYRQFAIPARISAKLALAAWPSKPERSARTMIALASPNARPRRRARGVTLVEVLIVVAILALIAGAVAIYAIPRFVKAQQDTAVTGVHTLRGIVDQWRLSRPDRASTCPTAELLVTDQMVRELPRDPWQHPYRFTCEAGAIAITSDGPDGRPGTEDDLGEGKPAPR